MRRRWIVPVVLAATAALAPPSSAAPAPQVTDPCGDADSQARLGPTTVVAEEADPARDLAAAGLRGVYEGATLVAVQASITACGPVAATGTGYQVQAAFGDDCYGTFAYRQVIDDTAATGRQVAVFEETCFEESTNPVFGNSERQVSSVELPASAVVLAGDTVSVTLPLASVPAASTARFAPGTAWESTLANAYGAPAAFVTGFGGTSIPGGDSQVRVDFAGGAGWTVGEDGPT